MTDDTSPQLGGYDIDGAALEAAGEPIEAVLAALGVTAQANGERLPQTGWRVLARPQAANGTVLIGAPAAADRSTWHVAHVNSTHKGVPRFAAYPDVLPIRPSVAERRGGLVLRWPRITQQLLDLDALAVDIVNDGAERRLPQGDAFFALATLRPVGAATQSAYYGFVAGGNPSVPLDPGEYARVVARIDPSAWRTLAPGPHEVVAYVPTLRMTTAEPLLIELSQQMIDVRRPALQPPVDRPRQPILGEDRLRHVRAIKAGRDAFPALIEAVREARDDEQALSRIQDLLDCDYPEAQAVYNMQLRRARVGYRDELALEIEDLERDVEAGDSGTAE